MQLELRSTILWLTGWSMPVTVFDGIRNLLPEFQHVSVDYTAASTSEDILRVTEIAATKALSMNTGPLLIGGWSLGGLLALRLATQGLADGLILFSATAKFIRPKGQTDLGWADMYIRQMIIGLRENRQMTELKFRKLALAEVESALCPPGGIWTTSALIGGLEILRNVDCLTCLTEINKPVLLVHGTEDNICPYAGAEQMFTLLPKAKLLSVPGSGHAPFLGKEDCIAESVRSWWHEQ